MTAGLRDDPYTVALRQVIASNVPRKDQEVVAALIVDLQEFLSQRFVGKRLGVDVSMHEVACALLQHLDALSARYNQCS